MKYIPGNRIYMHIIYIIYIYIIIYIYNYTVTCIIIIVDVVKMRNPKHDYISRFFWHIVMI